MPNAPGPFGRLRRLLLGAPRDFADRAIFHKLALVPLLAWIGLGSDALSSCAYGPEEAFKFLKGNEYLALPLAAATALTVCLLAAAYSALVESFPFGGGYGVATRMLGRHAGLVAGSALILDYVFTIAISLAAAAAAFLSLLPPEMAHLRMPLTLAGIALLTVLNLRGVREPIYALAPVFAIFLVVHALLIGAGIITQVPHAVETARHVGAGFVGGWESLGAIGMLTLFIGAFVIGGGTYTGIEAVSNGLPLLREPRVANAKRTLLYIAVSLATVAAGLIVCYLLWDIHPVEGRTMNASLATAVFGPWPGGTALVWAAMLSAAALLVAAAQAGFVGGPRVVANMAVDGWMPRKYCALSERLTTGNAVLVMAYGAALAIFVTGGEIESLVIIYAISVFLTFFLSMLGMLRYWVRVKRGERKRRRRIVLFATASLVCGVVLAHACITHLHDGALLAAGAIAAVAVGGILINNHYRGVTMGLLRLYRQLEDIPVATTVDPGPVPANQPIAAILVSGYNGIGVHTVLNAMRAFPGHFKGVMFISVGVIDSGSFKGEDAVDELRRKVEGDLARYVQLARSQGLPADSRMAMGTDVVDEAEKLCLAVATEHPRATFFAGKVVFRRETWYHRWLHNDAALALLRRLQLAGRVVVVLPARIS
ncbi:MAG: APC family permease [Planctomycetes bacterium]|nr:APC family permease [Planctomycetota bacterium]